MEEQIEKLIEKAWGKLRVTPNDQRLLIGISGIPGSGKTTLAALIKSRLDVLAGTPVAAFVPMDGYHLTRAQLSAMPDPEEAHRRRGAAFTFDGNAFLELVREVRAPLTTSTVTIQAPSFDHAKKDPVENDIDIPVSARVVIFEGNYLALDKSDWRQAGELMDEIWFVEVEEGVARDRLARRHVKAGIVDTYEQGLERADGNDLVNGREITAGRWKVDETVISREDQGWK